MTQSWVRLTVLLPALLSCAACGSVRDEDHLGEPVVTVVARLDVAPPMLPDDQLRATLVWLNGPPYGGARCQDDFCISTGREYTVLTTSDVAVETKFPLTVKLGMFELPNPIPGPYEGFVGTDEGELKLVYNSLPEAEIVLYEDGNRNGKLDFVTPGQPGPGPDRVVALSSGLDEQGLAVRTVIVNKRSPIPAGFANDANAPALDLFALPLPVELTKNWPEITPELAAAALFLPAGVAPPQEYQDGVYALKLTAPASLRGVQQYLLAAHTLVGEPNTNDASLSWFTSRAVEPIDSAVVQLFPVTADRKSWLSRACNPFDDYTNSRIAPPPGAEVQCGAGALQYATNPGDYCGWTRAIDYARFMDGEPAWWPCDANGRLESGQPYREAAVALELDLRNPEASYLDITSEEDMDCASGRIHHFDGNPGLRMPTAQPPAGSQVMCYGPSSFSFIAPRSDGCRIKRTYDLSSAAGTQTNAWDYSAAPPAWWPCDAQGQLRNDRGFVPADTRPATSCRVKDEKLGPWTPLPKPGKVRCENPIELRYEPLWSDGCPARQFALIRADETHTWEIERPAWWPCDADGNFLPEKGYLPL